MAFVGIWIHACIQPFVINEITYIFNLLIILLIFSKSIYTNINLSCFPFAHSHNYSQLDPLHQFAAGLKVAYKIFPEGLLFGRPPASILPAPTGGSRGKQRGCRMSDTSSSIGSVGGANDTLNDTLADLDDPRRFSFTTQDIDTIDEYLDTALLKRNVNCQ